MPKHNRPATAAFQLVDGNDEPVMPAVVVPEKVDRIPDEWMRVVRAAAEGDQLSMAELSRCTGISLTVLRERAAAESWRTPTRLKDEAAKRVDEILGDIIGGMTASVDGGDGDEDESGQLDLRRYEATPKKFRPKDCELLPGGDENQREKTAKLVAALDSVRDNVRSELARRSDIHQLAMSEVTQVAMVNVMAKVQEDPMLAVLYAKQLEAMDRMARRNFRLDESKDPTAGAKTVVIMSQPGFIPKPAITREAEIVSETESAESPDDMGSPPTGLLTNQDHENPD